MNGDADRLRRAVQAEDLAAGSPRGEPRRGLSRIKEIE